MRWTDNEPDKAVCDEVTGLLLGLRRLPEGTVLTLSDAAKAVWKPWLDGTLSQSRSSVGAMKGVRAKLPRQVLRIALILHSLTFGEKLHREVSAETLQGAIDICEYHSVQARKVIFELRAGVEKYPRSALSSRILRVLRNHSPDWVSTSEIHSCLGNHVEGTKLQDELEKLVSIGVVEPRVVKTPGRPRQEWRLS